MQPLEQPTIEIFVLGSDQAHMLENVDEDVFDHAVRGDLVVAYLADPRNLLVVALHESKVIGMASGILYLHPDKPLQLFVNEVGVSERYQGLGIGKKLVLRILEHARSRGCVDAWVATEEGNTAARALYKATNGKEDAEHAVVYTWKFEGERAPVTSYKNFSWFQDLAVLGRKQGFLTYAQINDVLPSEIVDPVEIVNVVEELQLLGIRVIEDLSKA